MTGTSAGDWQILGQLSDASNATLLVLVGGVRHVYKPVRGERPLWDFPTGTLGAREVAAYELSRELGWDLVPPTRWVDTDAPFGPGSLQEWVVDTDLPVGVFRPVEVPTGWLPVIEAVDEDDRPLVIAHDDTPALRRAAAFDLVANNADRKGSHLLVGNSGRLHGIDHGLCFHTDDKVRTVLWGFAGQPIAAGVLADLTRVREALPRVLDRLTADEQEATDRRLQDLIDTATFPPPRQGPAIPWPPV